MASKDSRHVNFTLGGDYQMTIGMKQIGPMALALGLLAFGLVEFQRNYKCELPTKNEMETVVPEVKEPTRAEIGKHELHMGW